MTKIFLKTLSSFYYERMIASAFIDFTEIVNMGMKLEEGVREGKLSREEVSSSKRYGNSFSKKKDSEANEVSIGRQKRPQIRRNQPQRQHHRQVSSVIPVFSKNQNPPQIPKPLPWWYKPELRCDFHQGAPGHDIENYYPLKYEVQKLVKCGMVSFEDRAPNVKSNRLPAHGNSSINMVGDCPREFKIYDVCFIRRSLVRMHKDIFLVSDCEHDHDGCVMCQP
ncbi:hypothetical protein KIW84_050316 [Lathyrus oleraceus]|uniref:Uncharacterized protein n=1 Tax=Pisum sativum TaxID=3888 RepID=A0A9D5ABX2_PEA|nr:hypothetical protein KIW84_050316 [Pisum sativum]